MLRYNSANFLSLFRIHDVPFSHLLRMKLVVPYLNTELNNVLEVVVYEGVIREKPSSKEEARKFIKGLFLIFFFDPIFL